MDDGFIFGGQFGKNLLVLIGVHRCRFAGFPFLAHIPEDLGRRNVHPVPV